MGRYTLVPFYEKPAFAVVQLTAPSVLAAAVRGGVVPRDEIDWLTPIQGLKNVWCNWQTNIVATLDVAVPRERARRASLYTTQLDFRGGTYLVQLEARSPREVEERLDEIIAWDALAPAARVRHMKVDEDVLTAVSRSKNVWRVRGRIDRSEAVVHIVATKARQEALSPRRRRS